MSSDSGAGRAEHVIVAPHLQPYPAYKLSGLEWLANIPAHWRNERGKSLLKKMKRPVRDTDEVVTCFRDGVVTLRKNRRTEGFTESLQEIGYQGIPRGRPRHSCNGWFCWCDWGRRLGWKRNAGILGLQVSALCQCLLLCLHTKGDGQKSVDCRACHWNSRTVH